MRIPFLVLLLACGAQAYAAAPNCRPGADRALQGWMDSLPGEFATAINNALIVAYANAGIAITPANIQFETKVSHDTEQFLGMVGDVTVTANGVTTLFIAADTSAPPESGYFVVGRFNLAGEPTPIYNSIGVQTGWSCYSSGFASSSVDLFNKSTGARVESISSHWPSEGQIKKYEEQFPYTGALSLGVR